MFLKRLCNFSRALKVAAVLYGVICLLLIPLLTGCDSKEEIVLPTVADWKEPPKSPTVNVAAAKSEPDPDGVFLVNVELAAEINSIMVNFKAPLDITNQWFQGSIYVINEATGLTYREIPVMPIIGPLFGKPREEGQPGYVMLTNFDKGVTAGSTVTVILGKYKREHITVGQSEIPLDIIKP